LSVVLEWEAPFTKPAQIAKPQAAIPLTTDN
jgi:hypothetical protein